MFCRLNSTMAEIRVYDGLSTLLLIGTIILIILIIFVFIYFKTVNKKQRHNFDNNQVSKNNYSLKEERLSQLDRLLKERQELQYKNRELEEDRELLIREIRGLELELKAYYNKYGHLTIDSSAQTKENINTLNANLSNSINKNNLEEYSDYTKIIVSFSFEEKNGTVKKDDSGDMYLEKSGEYYELLFGKEIFGTAIHLEQLQYSCKIINPKEANNKPMVVVKKPKYLYDPSEGKGILYQKGEVKYQ